MNPNYEKLPKGWEALMSGAYEQGCSDVVVRSRLRMSEGVWDSLYNDPVNGSFREIVQFGRGMAKAWWLEQARQALRDKTFNANLWYMVMKNQYGYSDKTTTSIKDDPDLTEDELNERLKRGFEKYAKVVLKERQQ